jgi:hypothetical protein
MGKGGAFFIYPTEGSVSFGLCGVYNYCWQPQITTISGEVVKMTDQEFINMVKREMRELTAHAVTSSGDQFAVWFGKTFLDLDVGDVVNKFHIGSSGDEKADLGIVDEAFPTKMIIQCKYSLNPLEKTYGKDEVDEVLIAKNRIETAPNDGNDRRKQFVQDYSSSKLPEKLIVVGLGKFTNLEGNNAYEYARTNGIHLYDFQRLKLEYTRIIDPASQKRPGKIEISKLAEKNFTCKHNSKKVIFTIIPASEIYTLIRDQGDGIFEENLRNQLPKARVSSLILGEIKRTLGEQDPYEFVIFNNGVTFITEQVVDQPDQPDEFQLINPQIINGCQTAYAIYEFYDSLRNSGKDIGRVESFVPVKIIETDTNDSKRNEQIARAANLQNPITPRDRYSNDKLQTELRSTFGSQTPKIFYDNKNGLWESVLRHNKQSNFKVPNTPGRTFRILNNQLAGQLYLSLLGKPNIAGNQKGVVFSDEKYYNAVFNYRLNKEIRFPNIGIDPVDAKLQSGEENFVKDVMFAYRIFRLLEAIELVIYPKKRSLYRDNPQDQNYEFYKKVATKEFVVFWHFHVIRLLHEIIFGIAQGNQESIEKIRKDLVSDEVNLFFGSNRTIASKFNIEERQQKYTILNVSNPSTEFALFGKWISNLEQIFYDVVSPEHEKPDWKGFNQFFYKRETTLNDLRVKVTDILGGVDAETKFPRALH